MKGSEEKAKRRARLLAAAARKFLATYKEAWETRNPELAASLFTRDAHYRENPFGQDIVGREAISSYWKAATEYQEEIQFRAQQTIRVGYHLVADWTCAYKQRLTGKRRELAGMFVADFYGKQVRNFREVWIGRDL